MWELDIDFGRQNHCFRFAVITKRLGQLGYSVHGDDYNAADFGVPQQRRRAWLICILRDELRSDLSNIAGDMKCFQRPCPPLTTCVLPGKLPAKVVGKKGYGAQSEKTKWKEGFEKECKVYGKAGHMTFVVYVMVFPHGLSRAARCTMVHTKQKRCSWC